MIDTKTSTPKTNRSRVNNQVVTTTAELSLTPILATISASKNIVTNLQALTLQTFPVNQTQSTLIEDVYKLSPGALIELFELDATMIKDTSDNFGTIYRFHSGKNELNTDITWQGNVYSAFPIEAEGFKLTSEGLLPKPKIKIANIDGAIAALNRSFSDLVGAKLSRKRTLIKYLDSINFASGNPLEDTSQYFPDDIYYVNRKVTENRVFIEYELASPMDVEGVKLPRRQIIQNVCPWVYRESECGYAGSSYWDVNDNVVLLITLDVCSKKIGACKLRFGEDSTLPYGGFPGAGLF